MLKAGARGRPREMVRGGKREEDSEWGTRGYLWRIHVDIWQNQYNIVKLKNKINLKKNSIRCTVRLLCNHPHHPRTFLYCNAETAAAAAELLQLCPTLCDPMDCSLPGSSVHGILQARVPEWGAIAFSNAV